MRESLNDVGVPDEGAVMSKIAVDGTRIGDVREEFEFLVAGAAFQPERARGTDARVLLEQDGAVILTGLPPEPDSLVLAAGRCLAPA
jgi:hypothetical protein